MGERSRSDSSEQKRAERIILKSVRSRLGIRLEQEPKLSVGTTYMQPDFYSEKHAVIGEIFCHIGKPKKAQDNKIANDILKMLLFEKLSGRTMRKMIIVCDSEEYDKLCGESVLAECIRAFGIEVRMIEISAALRKRILKAQDRQKMVNS